MLRNENFVMNCGGLQKLYGGFISLGDEIFITFETVVYL